jgi:hypothetical protein
LGASTQRYVSDFDGDIVMWQRRVSLKPTASQPE